MNDIEAAFQVMQWLKKAGHEVVNEDDINAEMEELEAIK